MSGFFLFFSIQFFVKSWVREEWQRDEEWTSAIMAAAVRIFKKNFTWTCGLFGFIFELNHRSFFETQTNEDFVTVVYIFFSRAEGESGKKSSLGMNCEKIKFYYTRVPWGNLMGNNLALCIIPSISLMVEWNKKSWELCISALWVNIDFTDSARLG